MEPKINCYNLTKTLLVLNEILDIRPLKQTDKHSRNILEEHMTMSILLMFKLQVM